MNTFFSELYLHKDKIDKNIVNFDYIFPYINAHFNIDLINNKDNEDANLEKIMSLLHISAAFESPDGGMLMRIVNPEDWMFKESSARSSHTHATVAYTFFLKSIDYLLTDKTKDVLQNSCELYDAIANSLDEGDHVINFNYDLLMDYALEKADKWYGLSSNGSGYRIPISKIMNFKETCACGECNYITNEIEKQSVTKSNKVRYTKLHGSLNWYLTYEEGNSFPNLLFLPLKDKLEAYLKKISNSHNFEQLIIPPIAYKTDVFKRYFASLWEKALETISSADEIYIVGYSLPQNDINAEWLLRRGLLMNKNNPKVYIINPSDNDRNRIKDKLDTSNIRLIEINAKAEDYFN